MNKKDDAIFKQAFDELENEGYFDDISEKIKQSKASTGLKGKSSSILRKSSANLKKTKKSPKVSRTKVKV